MIIDSLHKVLQDEPFGFPAGKQYIGYHHLTQRVGLDISFVTVVEDGFTGEVVVYFDGVAEYRVPCPSPTFWEHVASRKVLRASECDNGKFYFIF